ncbi:hypothetical protein I2F27_12420 [Acinetobacter sp. B5B]|uniref:hypothetical protein n=1 Tax=Acinetobacter baretiae TaxID=2605383 RepID=UPI0018C2ABFC|nr:hypothetical protein [Acinetobacter baretiae]MBF7684093.1 hypothetical protein [Acinetobacter baretiae]
MLGFIGFLVVAFFAFKILRFLFGSPEKNFERAQKRWLIDPTDANYKFMIAAKIRSEKNRN